MKHVYFEESKYSVTQSLSNSFWGDVVLDTFNNESRDEDNISDQIYIKQICSDFDDEDLKFESDWRKCIFKEIQPSTRKSW